jgi:hypothetical protein
MGEAMGEGRGWERGKAEKGVDNGRIFQLSVHCTVESHIPL